MMNNRKHPSFPPVCANQAEMCAIQKQDCNPHCVKFHKSAVLSQQLYNKIYYITNSNYGLALVKMFLVEISPRNKILS